MTGTLLTPREIDRARDLIALGALTVDVECDLRLAEVGLAKPDVDNINEGVVVSMRKLIDGARARLAAGRKLAGDFLVAPTIQAHERFYNRQGGVRGKWWRASRQTFAEYMNQGTAHIPVPELGTPEVPCATCSV